MDEHAVLQCPITADLGTLRDQVRDFAAAAGFAGTRLDDVLLVVGEATANVLEHGSGSGTLLARADSGGLAVEVVDPAGTLTNERFQHHVTTPPPIGRPGGRGGGGCGSSPGYATRSASITPTAGAACGCA
ncbi:ATP-binding protein [Nonomuraea sp. SYSU D8015]|uniref:ATP-binding protein n=1 Tax=Nonomuraea sp. SYSU D8015 TaxID=2593644 RepID=UPI001660EAEA|nr:ATP-binding protein [Nonomuraea sp. SYSU D8015]